MSEGSVEEVEENVEEHLLNISQIGQICVTFAKIQSPYTELS